jgi:hypothetical protein
MDGLERRSDLSLVNGLRELSYGPAYGHSGCVHGTHPEALGDLRQAPLDLDARHDHFSFLCVELQ